jgi:hypothetical protein
MSCPKLIYYAQTFVGNNPNSLQRLADAHLENVHIYLSSLHIGVDPHTNQPYLHLNDTDVRELDAFFDDVHRICDAGQMRVKAMLGGAGGAYTALFADFEPRYALLRAFFKQHPWIGGIDLDVEEVLAEDPAEALRMIRMLIRRLSADMGDTFVLTMAPVAGSLVSGSTTGMGNFSYAQLYQTAEGQRINWFNVQAYGCYDCVTYEAMLKAGYPAEKLVFGMLGDQYEGATAFGNAMNELEQIACDHPTNFAGAVLWEYGDTQVDPVTWGQAVRRAIVAGSKPMSSVGGALATMNECVTM